METAIKILFTILIIGFGTIGALLQMGATKQGREYDRIMRKELEKRESNTISPSE